MTPTLSSCRWLRLLVTVATLGPLAAQAELSVPIGYAGDPTASASLGAQQGHREAQIQGDFLGQRYTLTPRLSEVSAIVAAVPPVALQALARAHPGVAVLNITVTDDAVRTACQPNLLHIIPSQKMLADARAQWQKAHPDSAAEAHAWHPAVKMVSDLVAREQTADPAVLLAALRNKLAFDGQKGSDLSFRDNGQLRQPLLLSADGKLLGEAPVRGVAAAEDLDSLGVVSCAGQP